jgi:hypothetical protein
VSVIDSRLRAGLSQLKPGWRAERAETLSDGGRAVVQRITVLNEDRQRIDIIGKLFTGPGDGLAREAAALSALSALSAAPAQPGLPVPRLLGELADPPMLLLSDAGTGPSVADALLGADASDARQAVCDWADALARLHAATLGSPGPFVTELASRASRAGGDGVPADPMAGLLKATAAGMAARSAATGLRVPDEMVEELAELSRRLTDPLASALSPDDPCPDNNVRDEHGALVLVDFEGACFRHVAWDVAYLTVPWPSCWCCWRLPDEVAATAVARYAAVIRPVLPQASGVAFPRSVDRAAIAWSVVTADWFIARALAGDPAMAEGGAAPGRRAFLLHRLALAAPLAAADGLPATAAALQQWRDTLAGQWGEISLPLAPA